MVSIGFVSVVLDVTWSGTASELLNSDLIVGVVVVTDEAAHLNSPEGSICPVLDGITALGSVESR